MKITAKLKSIMDILKDGHRDPKLLFISALVAAGSGELVFVLALSVLDAQPSGLAQLVVQATITAVVTGLVTGLAFLLVVQYATNAHVRRNAL